MKIVQREKHGMKKISHVARRGINPDDSSGVHVSHLEMTRQTH